MVSRRIPTKKEKADLLSDLPCGRSLIRLITLIDKCLDGKAQRIDQGSQRIVAAACDLNTDTPAILIHSGLEEKIALIAADGEIGSGSLFPAAAAFKSCGSGLDLKVGLGVFYLPAECLEFHSVDLLGTFRNCVHLIFLLRFVVEWVQRHSAQGESRFLDIRQASSQSDLPSSVPNRGVFIMKRKKRAEPLVAQLI